MEPYESELDFRVLHTIRCIGVAGEDRVATAAGMGIGETLIHLRSLSERGLVVLDPGPFGGWGLTESGRITDQELVRDLASTATVSRQRLSERLGTSRDEERGVTSAPR